MNFRYFSEPLNPFILQETVTYSLSKRYVWVDDFPFPTVGICGFPNVGLTSTLTFSAEKVMAPKTSGMPEAKWSKVASQFWFCLQGTQGIWCIWEIHQDSEVHQPRIPWNIFEGSICIYTHTLPQTNGSPLAPENRPAPKGNLILRLLIFRSYVSLRGGKLGGFCTWQLHVLRNFKPMGTSMMLAWLKL